MNYYINFLYNTLTKILSEDTKTEIYYASLLLKSYYKDYLSNIDFHFIETYPRRKPEK